MKPGLTKEDHRRLARDLKKARDFLQSQSRRLANAYGVSHKVGKRAFNTVNALARLRSELDSLYGEKFGELSPYYGDHE